MSLELGKVYSGTHGQKGQWCPTRMAFADECRSSRTKEARDGRRLTSYTHMRLKVQRHAFGADIIGFCSTRLAIEKGERYHAPMARSRGDEMASSPLSLGTPVLRFTL